MFLKPDAIRTFGDSWTFIWTRAILVHLELFHAGLNLPCCFETFLADFEALST